MNRAVAIGELEGPERGLAELAALDADRLDAYQPYHATRADLLARIGDTAAALEAYDRALDLTTNAGEATFLVEQRRRVEQSPPR